MILLDIMLKLVYYIIINNNNYIPDSLSNKTPILMF